MSMALTLALTGWRAVAKLLARTGVGWWDGEIASWWLLGRSSRSKSTHLHGLAKTTSGTSGSWWYRSRLKAAQRWGGTHTV